MLHAWRERTRARSWIALVAAYAFVLHAMLSGVALSQMAAAVASDLPVVLCAGGHADDATGSGGSDQTDKAISCAACAICAFAGALATPPAGAHAARLPIVTGAALALPAQLAPVAARTAGPRLSQGPPPIA
jgi:hypothetical protein